MNKEQVLKQYFGYDEFRPLQAEIIDTVLAGDDCLVLMPTGGGKSVCYQVPALVMPGMAVVISPLIALMKDQVQALQANGVAAAYINSSLTGAEQSAVIKDCTEGRLKILYVSPEKIFSGGFLDYLRSLTVSLFAVDESHCVSFWGHDFRPEYAQLKVLKHNFPHIPVIALTATADKVTRRDILQQLDIAGAKVFIASFDRPNLSLTVLPGQNRLKAIHDFLLKHRNESGIIYCLSRKATETVAQKLTDSGFPAKHYHAGMESTERSNVQDEFIRDNVQIIVATIAFGMGIDKSNVRWVLHYNMPKNVESFYQEIGRAGRDGMPSDTVLFYSYADVMQQMKFNEEATPERKALLNAKLDRMRQYAEADICRRRVLLSYFNEGVTKDCGNCDVCRNPRTRFDGTVLAQKVLSAVARTGEKVALGLLIDILRGSFRREITDRGYDQLKTFGAGKDLRHEEWADYIFQMLNSGVLDIAYDEGHAFKLNPTSWQVLKENHPVRLSAFVPFEARRKADEEAAARTQKREVVRDELFERLRTVRKQLADSENVPAYIVFSDTTISDMAQKKPISQAEMMQVTGVGEAKFNRYGQVFINAILDFVGQDKNSARLLGMDTHEVTYQLYEQKLSLEDIAKKRGFAPGTVFSHLLKLHQEQGVDIEWSRFISPSEYGVVVNGARLLNYQKGDRIQPLFEHLEQQYSYEKIRISLLIWEKEKVSV